ncbi:MAG: ABC transporter ATP-binding protein [Mesorhizobium sp.]|nr:MAG: ABC transporter ATP-binding protein [Mesorhizobium sp.]
MGIEVKSVYKRFGAFTAVNGVSVDIKDGEFFVMLGPSGCGKTTTLRMIAGLELPSGGQIKINGRDVTYEEPRHRDIAMAFQDYGLYPHLSVFQNIEFPLKVRKIAEGERKKKVQATAEKLGIAEYLDRKPGQISGGQRQRVSLARALVRNPRVFLMDEPLSNLDAKLRATMRTEIKKLVTSLGITTVYVTHDQIEAMSMADRIAVMHRGDMVQVATPLEIYDRPRTEFVADFIGSPPMNLFPAHFDGKKGIAASVQPFADSLSGEVADRASSFADAQGQFYVGVRPEHLMIVRDGVEGAASVNVDFVEPLGQTTNVYVDCGGHKFIVVTDRTEAKIGDVVGVAVTPGKSRLVARN